MVFDSVYQITDELNATPRKQRFWEFFDGTSLDSRWNQHDIIGTGTVAMVALADEGLRITVNWLVKKITRLKKTNRIIFINFR